MGKVAREYFARTVRYFVKFKLGLSKRHLNHFASAFPELVYRAEALGRLPLMILERVPDGCSKRLLASLLGRRRDEELHQCDFGRRLTLGALGKCIFGFFRHRKGNG